MKQGKAKDMPVRVYMAGSMRSGEGVAAAWGHEKAIIERHDHDMWFLCEIADRIEYCEKKYASTRFFNWAAWQPITRGEPCPW